MSIRRRCPNCQTFTEDSDYCENCGELINFELIRKKEKKEKVQDPVFEPSQRIDDLLSRIKHSKFFLFRWIYQLAYSIWFVFAAILSFFMFVIATMPG